MSYTIPEYVDTKEQAVLALASTIADEDKSALGDGSVNRALDVLADTLAGENVGVPQTNAGAILALAQYVKGGGGGGGASYDAVIRLTHAENSAYDDTDNITPSIVDGTYADLVAKIQGGGCPCILVEYANPFLGTCYAAPMGFVSLYTESAVVIYIAGFFRLEGATSPFGLLGTVSWTSSDTIAWGD